MQMDSYDEDLTENEWYNILSTKHDDLFHRATNERWMICIPRIGSWKSAIEDGDLFAQKYFESHILKPVMVFGSDAADNSAHPANKYITYNGKEVIIKGSKISCAKGFSYNYNQPSFEKRSENLLLNVKTCHTATILFEETFFNQNDESYLVLCISAPLEPSIVLQKNDSNSNQSKDVPDMNLESYGAYLWKKATHPNKLRQLIEEKISQFILNPSSLKDCRNDNTLKKEVDLLLERVLNFLSACLHVILRDNKVKKLSEIPAEKESIKYALEEFVMHRIGRLVLQRLNDLHATQDSRFNKITRNLSAITPNDLGIKEIFSLSLPRASRDLSRFNRCRTTMEKLAVLHSAITHLSSKPKQVYSDESLVITPVEEKGFDENSLALQNCQNEDTALSTDDLLPILIYLIIKCDVNNWLSNLCYLKNFYFSKPRLCSAGFYMATLEAALEHIRNRNVVIDRFGPVKRQNSRSDLDDFFTALKNGEVENVKRLLRQAEDIKNLHEHDKCHPLCECNKCQRLTSRNSSDSVRSYVSVGSRDEKGRTPLHIASISGKHELVEVLIELKSDLNSSDYHGSTPLHLACQEGNQSAIFLLLHYGANPNAEDNNKNTPLHLACMGGHESCVKALLFYDPVTTVVKVNAPNDVGDTPLHFASKWGYVSIVTCLMEYGAGLHQTNRRNVTPYNVAHNSTVAYALKNTEVNNLRLIADGSIGNIENSSTIKAYQKNFPKRTVSILKSNLPKEDDVVEKQVEKLLRAVKDNDLNMVSYVCGWNSAPKKETSKCHPLCQCVKCQPLTQDVFLHANSGNKEGITSLLLASKLGYYEMVKLLLEHGANANVKTKSKGHSPLHLAAQYGHKEIVESLLSAKAQSDARDHDGSTPIYMSAMNGHCDCTQLLLQAGASVNLRNHRGDSPLHEAVRWKHCSTACLLIQYGALGYYKNNKEQTVLDLAERDRELREALIDALNAEDIWKDCEIAANSSFSTNNALSPSHDSSITQSEADDLIADDLLNHFRPTPSTPPMLDVSLDKQSHSQNKDSLKAVTSLLLDSSANAFIPDSNSLENLEESTSPGFDATEQSKPPIKSEAKLPDSRCPPVYSKEVLSLAVHTVTFEPSLVNELSESPEKSTCTSSHDSTCSTVSGDVSSYFEITSKELSQASPKTQPYQHLADEIKSDIINVCEDSEKLAKEENENYLSLGESRKS